MAILDSLVGSTLSREFIGREVEADEQKEVAAQDTTTSKGSELLASTSARIGHPRPVGRGEVSVRSEVDEAEVNNKLDDLKTRDPLLPPNTDTTSGLEIVPIHDHMDHEVKRDRDPRN